MSTLFHFFPCILIETDGELINEYFSFEMAELIRNSGPWGQGFPEPTFDGEFHLIEQRIVGQRHLKLLVKVPGSEHTIEGIAFNVNLDEWPNHHCQSARLVYRLDINEYRGRKKFQLLVEDLQIE